MKVDVPITEAMNTRTSGHFDNYKNITLQLDGSKEDEILVAHAEILATAFGSHLTGLFTSILPDILLYANDMGTASSLDMVDQIRLRTTAAIERLQSRFERLSPLHELRRVEDFAGWLPSLMATEIRTSDLFIGTCPREQEAGFDWKRLIEAALFESGRGVYLVPPAQPPRQAIRTALVGWTDTKEAARAVAEAMPLLRLASRTKIVTVNEADQNGNLDKNADLADIATYLARHGVETVVEALTLDQSVANTLLREAHRISADLLVVGAYGHSRLREWIMGGTTAELLETTDIPLLMAH